MIRSKGNSCLMLPDSKVLKICKKINNRKYYEKYDDDDDGISENSILIGSAKKNIVRTVAMVHCNNNVDDYNVSTNEEKETIDVDKNDVDPDKGGDGGEGDDKNIDADDDNYAVVQKTNISNNNNKNNSGSSNTLYDKSNAVVDDGLNENGGYENEKDVERGGADRVYVSSSGENVIRKEQEMIGNYVHMGFKNNYASGNDKKENRVFVDNNIDDDNVEDESRYMSMDVGKLYKLLKYNNSSDFEDYTDEPNNISLLKRPYKGSYNNNNGNGGGGKIKTKNMYSFNKCLNKKIKEFGYDVPSTKHGRGCNNNNCGSITGSSSSRSILKMKNNSSTFKSYIFESTERKSSSSTMTSAEAEAASAAAAAAAAGYDSPRKRSTFKSYVDSSPNASYGTLSSNRSLRGNSDRREDGGIVKEHRRSKLLKSKNRNNNDADYVDINDIIVDDSNSIIIKQKGYDENGISRSAANSVENDEEEEEEEREEEEEEKKERLRKSSVGALNACLKKMEYVKKRKHEENLKFEEKRRQAIENNYDKCCIDTLCKLNELSRKIDYVVRRIEFQNKKLNVVYSYVERQNEIYYRNKVVPQQSLPFAGGETGGETDVNTAAADTQTFDVANHSYSEIMKKVSIYDRMKKCFCCL